MNIDIAYSHILDVVTMNLVIYIGYSDNLSKIPCLPIITISIMYCIRLRYNSLLWNEGLVLGKI